MIDGVREERVQNVHHFWIMTADNPKWSMDYFLMGLIATIVVLAAVAIGAVVYNECIAKRNAYVNVPKQNI
ncbi:hypothetical protein PRIPAC_89123 [Pristionchus pacificus]|uniref:Uncharacterized protein n=1 Tax=Pristionchus pacificus TaxID=54126 RepID=A0A2A6CWW8_PRIPA|nr:hypothetical protein PRIPAC_89123 [Pristionchus pacificus]|eukprot:PDM82722.1 hypothetical protein PRIPAC_37115 [Pristionchus pacificus]